MKIGSYWFAPWNRGWFLSHYPGLRINRSVSMKSLTDMLSLITGYLRIVTTGWAARLFFTFNGYHGLTIRDWLALLSHYYITRTQIMARVLSGQLLSVISLLLRFFYMSFKRIWYPTTQHTIASYFISFIVTCHGVIFMPQKALYLISHHQNTDSHRGFTVLV